MQEHKWEFRSRFRSKAFGWKSQLPIKRIREAISEIRKVARKESELGAEGAVLFLERLSPAIMNVDSSSGAMGAAVNKAISTLVPIIAKPKVDMGVRQKWLERLWQALQDDDIPYIEYLGEFWGELCASEELASAWADKFIGTVRLAWNTKTSSYGYFNGTVPCISALYAAARYDELLALLAMRTHKHWFEQQWGVKALVAMGKPEEALDYAQSTDGLNAPVTAIARTCEEILLTIGKIDEAYARFAFIANQATTKLATFRAIAKKYPMKKPNNILEDLVSIQPGEEGKWFASAKHAGLFDLAIKLASQSPTDPRTLTRAAKEYATTRPDFAVEAGMLSLHWITHGYGYEIDSGDVISAYLAIIEAAGVAKIDKTNLNTRILDLINEGGINDRLMKTILINYLTD